MDDLHKREEHRCIGWHCLTDAQKFGIIFSVVVVTIVLAIAWMCYLGKVVNKHRQRFTKPLPGGIRAVQRPELPSNTALGHMPVAQQWPGHPPQIYYQPVMYRLEPSQPPRAYPWTGTGWFQQQMPFPARGIHRPNAIMAPQPPHQDSATRAARVNRSRSRTPRRDESSGSSHRFGNAQAPISWRQRLNRLLHLPVGRASTIASSEHTRRSGSRSTRSSYEGSHSAGDRNDVSGRGEQLNSIAPHRQSSGSSARISESGGQQSLQGHRREEQQVGEAASIDTNVATVHSDDYDMPVRTSSAGTAPQEEEGLPQVASPSDYYRTSTHTANNVAATESPQYSDSFLSVSSVFSETDVSKKPKTAVGESGQIRGPRESDLHTQSSVPVRRGLHDFRERESARSHWENR